MLISATILLILILISGVISSSEIAISAANRNRVKMRADNGDKKAARLLATIDEPHSFFATTQLYCTFIAFFSGAYAANSFTGPLVNFASGLGLSIPGKLAETVAFILVTAILTYVSLIVGELVPKRIAMGYSIPFSLRVLPVLNVLSILAFPFVKILSVSAKVVLKLLRFKDNSPEEEITKAELSQMMASSREHGHIAENEQGMIENILKIDKLTAGDICTHRPDVVALPVDAGYESVLNMLTGEYYSRVPVYEENLDNICGILYTKDVLRFMAKDPDPVNFDLTTLIRNVHFVPFSKKAEELFQEMRRKRAYMSVVIDEYGGTMGIVTMEDLVETIVGSIHDEYDTEELPPIDPINETTFRIQGATGLELVRNYFGVPLPVDDYETMSGFLIGQLGHIPSEGEKPEITFNELLFKVESLGEKRIDTVMVTLIKTLSTD